MFIFILLYVYKYIYIYLIIYLFVLVALLIDQKDFQNHFQKDDKWRQLGTPRWRPRAVGDVSSVNCLPGRFSGSSAGQLRNSQQKNIYI